MKIKLLLSLLFTLCVCQIRAQHLPKLSDLGLSQVASVTFPSDINSYNPTLFLDYTNGYITSGKCKWHDENDPLNYLEINISSNPLTINYVEQSSKNLFYINGTIGNFVFNRDGTVAQYSVEATEFSDYIQRHTETFTVFLSYDNEQHLIKLESPSCIVENEWIGGNITHSTRSYPMENYSIYEVYTYGKDLNPGIDLWHTDKRYCLFMPLEVLGIFGRTTINLPIASIYSISDEGTFQGSYNYTFDEQKRVLSVGNFRQYTYENDTYIGKLSDSHSMIDNFRFSVDGTFNVGSNRIQIIKNADGTVNKVYIK